MNTLVLNEKEKLLMKHIYQEYNKTEEQKQTLKKEAELLDKENKQRSCIKSAHEELERCFCNSFEREGIKNASINLSLKTTRDDILAHIPESREEYDYLNANYEKILNKIRKVYINDAKAQEQMQQIIIEKQIEEQQRREEEIKKSPIYKIFLGVGVIAVILFFLIKWGLIFGIGLCVLIFLVILGCSKK